MYDELWNIFLSLLFYSCIIIYLFIYCLFAISWAALVAYGNSQARGWIGVASATYTTAHGNAGSLTPWARPGIEPVSSWMLGRCVSTELWWELQLWKFLKMPLSLVLKPPNLTVCLECFAFPLVNWHFYVKHFPGFWCRKFRCRTWKPGLKIFTWSWRQIQK